MSIKYYHLAKDEKPPDEFCAVRDMGGEPGEYMFYVPEAENAKLREELADAPRCEACEAMLDCDECLRADGSHKERRRLSAENARLRDELESVGTAAYLYGRSDLKAENAKLREEIEAAKHDLQVFSANLARLGAENAKLLELIADVHMALCLDKTGVFREPIIKSLERDMRELGMEVEESDVSAGLRVEDAERTQ